MNHVAIVGNHGKGNVTMTLFIKDERHAQKKRFHSTVCACRVYSLGGIASVKRLWSYLRYTVLLQSPARSSRPIVHFSMRKYEDAV